ncbi:hypothetical protein V6N12_032690 [Hibiscus sabdariffa]|uniref:Uncharacterized protein n=1 Tax=Hibiscus sabdariffa TaxID=183260 RepID=A0ABR2BNH5_9ROSI
MEFQYASLLVDCVILKANTGSASNLSPQAANDLIATFGSDEHDWFSSCTFPLQATNGINASNESLVPPGSEVMSQPAPVVEPSPTEAQQLYESVDASQAQQCVAGNESDESYLPHQQVNDAPANTSSTHSLPQSDSLELQEEQEAG